MTTKTHASSNNIKYKNCNLCESDDTKLWAEYDEIKIVQCNRCGLIYKNPVFEDVDAASLYEKEYWINPEREQKDEKHNRNIMYDLEIKKLELYLNGGKIFDCGCGHGIFLSLLDGKWEKYGCDPSVYGIDYAKKEHGLQNVYCGTIFDSDLPDGTFDAIYMRGVIHHTSNPKETLLRAHKMLRKNGLLAITMSANFGSICARLFQDRFHLIDGVRNNYFFSARTLTMLLRKTSFLPEEIWNPYFGTGYASWKDITDLIINFCKIKMHYLTHEKRLKNSKDFFKYGVLGSNCIKSQIRSSSFYGNIMCIYSRKDG